MKEYFYRLHYSRYCFERIMEKSRKYRKEKVLQVRIGEGSNTFKEYVGIVNWQSRMDHIKKEISNVRKLKAESRMNKSQRPLQPVSNPDHLMAFYLRC